MKYSVCVDNHKKTDIPEMVVDWTVPFLNLHFDRQKARERHFADNGKHWQYSDTDDSFRTVILDIYLDENDHIRDLSMSKYRANSYNHGKNSANSLNVASADIKKFTAKLAEVVTDHSDEELTHLLQSIQQSDFGKKRKFTVRKNDIILLDDKGELQTVKQKAILAAIQASHVYLEVLRNDEFFDLDPKTFSAENRTVLHEILSFVDSSDYYRIDELKNEMELRKLIATADENYPLLRQAVIKGDTKEVKRLAAYAKFMPIADREGSPLYYAVVKNRVDLAEILLQNGAYVLQNDRFDKQFPLEIAYMNKNRDMAHLLIRFHGAKVQTYFVNYHNIDNVLTECVKNKDYESLELMAPDAFVAEEGIWLKPDMFPELNDEEIKVISNYPGIRIAWDIDRIRPVYEKKDLELCRRLLLQGSTVQVVEYFISVKDFDMFEASLSRHTGIEIRVRDEEFFEWDRKWFVCLREHSSRTILAGGVVWYMIYSDLSDYLTKLLDHAEFEHYKELLNKFDYKGYSALGCYKEIHNPEKVHDPGAYCSFVDYMLDHYQPNRSRFLEDIVRYFGDDALTRKYNQQCPVRKDYNSTADGFWRKYGEEEFLPRYILDKNATLIAGAELIRYSFGAEPFDDIGRVAVRFAENIINVCSDNIPSLSGEEQDKCRLRAVNCMKALLEKIDLKELDLAVQKANFALSIENTAAWFAYKKVNYQPMLDLVKHE